MKKMKLGMYVCLMILLGGCIAQENNNQTDITQWKPTEPVEQEQPTVPEINEENTEKVNTPDFLPGENGEELYSFSTCFYDTNGLLCVGVKAVFYPESGQCEIEKQYYLPDAELFRIKECVQGKESLEELLPCAIKEEYETNAYESIPFHTITGHVWDTAGNLVKTADLLGDSYANKFVCTGKEDYIPVTAGEKIRLQFYFSWFSQVGGIVFLDGEDRLVSSYSFASSTTFENQIILVPESAEKMHLSLFAIQPYTIEKQVTLAGADLGKISKADYAEHSMEIINNLPKTAEGKVTLDKAYITFVVDDCRTDLDQIADIFEQYNLPLCVAAVNKHLPFAASNKTETLLDVCKRIEQAGGELLAHDEEILTEELLSDYETMVKHFVKDKFQLLQHGFDVNGIILAGGDGQVVGSSSSDGWARAFYQYSDLYGEKKYGEPYYHQRQWLGSYVNKYEQTIKTAIKEKKWIVFYFHDLSEVNAGKLQEILSFVSEVSPKEAEVVTYKTMCERMQH